MGTVKGGVANNSQALLKRMDRITRATVCW